MADSLGKKFESVVKEAFEKVEGVSIDRIHDQMNGYAGSTNISDFILYKYPHEYYIECKSVHGNTLPFSNITRNQWDGMLKKSLIDGVIAGVICWWVEKDTTRFIPIELLEVLKVNGAKSIRYDYVSYLDAHTMAMYPHAATFLTTHKIQGKKKRVFYDYDMEAFLNEF